MRSYFILGMCILFLVQYFVQTEWLQIVVVLLSLVAFIGSAKHADRFPRLLGLVMMSVGMIVEWNKGTGIKGIGDGIFLILPLLSLIILAPLISIPLRQGGWFSSISLLLNNLLHRPRKLYAGITGTLFLLTPILNLGSIRIMNDLLEDLKLPSVMSAKSYVVGFSTATLWSPYFASVSLILHYLNIPFKGFMLYGLGFSVFMLLMGNLMFYFWEKRHPMKITHSSEVPLRKDQRSHIFKLALFVIILMSTCLFLERITGWSMIVIVCLISIIFPLLFGIFSRDWKRLISLIIDYRDRTVPMVNNEIMLFMSAGMLAFALKGTNVMNGVSLFLNSLANQSFFLGALAIIFIVFCLTYVGIHQIAVVGALAMQLNAAELGMGNNALAMILLLSWAISTAVSPFSGLNLMVSRFVRLSGIQVGLRINGFYLLAVTFIGLAIISFIG
jgi:uncharacterized protein YjeT (DUF2065 family)